jgi:hypothetical protein
MAMGRPTFSHRSISVTPSAEGASKVYDRDSWNSAGCGRVVTRTASFAWS